MDVHKKDLAKHCHIQPATATSLLSHLERSGLIYREANQEDRRITNVFLTETGFEAQKQVKQTFCEIDECCFCRIYKRGKRRSPWLPEPNV